MSTLAKIVRNPWTLAALTLGLLVLSGVAKPAPAKADLVLNGHLRLGNVRVDVHSGGSPRMVMVHRANHAPRRIVVEHRQLVTLRPVDRKIAKRLARFTGYRKQLLLELRRDGYNWWEIGQLLDIPRQVVRASLERTNARGWNKRAPRAFVTCGP